MISQMLGALYRLLPAYAANMAAPFSKYWPGRNWPISDRWLGAHKTVIGFALGVAAAVVVSLGLSAIAWSPDGTAPSGGWRNGLAQGIGAMTGDALKSFFKRRIAIPPGARWIPADQLDFVVGAMLAAWPWLHFGPAEVVLVLVFTFFAHIAVNHIAHSVGIRDTDW